MNPARVISGVVTDYPYLLRPTAKQAHPEVSPLPGAWELCSPEQLAALECVEVQAVAWPTLQPGESVHEGTPEYIDGQWRQTWVVTPAPSDAAVIVGLIAEIKQLARAHILATLPEWKQANATARGLELLSIIAPSRALTEQETAELAALQAAWAWVKAVRAASDAAEAALDSMTRAELDNWSEPTWPVFGA